MRQPYRFESLTLENVGVFDHLHLNFKPIESEEADAEKAEIHLLTGNNGSGKSTVIYALASLLSDAHAESMPVQCRMRRESWKLNAKFSSGSSSRSSSDGGHLRSIDSPPSNHPILDAAGASHNRCAAFSYSGERIVSGVGIEGFHVASFSPFADALSFNQSVNGDQLIGWLRYKLTQLAVAREAKSELADLFKRSLDRIASLINDVCDLDVAFKLNPENLKVLFSVNSNDLVFQNLPDGLKSIISWVADLSIRLEAIPWEKKNVDVFAQPIILLLDEIDIHLHPKWQRKVLPAVQKLLPNAQIFATTHSPFVVGSVKDAWIHKLPDPINGHTSATIQPVRSGAGKSYQLILREIFDIDEEFDPETEELFDRFYKVRNQVLRSESKPEELVQVARPLADRGDEAKVIVEAELRQVSKRINKEVRLAEAGQA